MRTLCNVAKVILILATILLVSYLLAGSNPKALGICFGVFSLILACTACCVGPLRFLNMLGPKGLKELDNLTKTPGEWADSSK